MSKEERIDLRMTLAELEELMTMVGKEHFHKPQSLSRRVAAKIQSAHQQLKCRLTGSAAQSRHSRENWATGEMSKINA